MHYFSFRKFLTLFLSVLFLFTKAQYVVQNEELQSVKFIRFDGSPNVRESEGLNWLKTQVLKADEEYSFKHLRSQGDELGYTHHKYQQYFRNIKVEHGIYILHAKNGYVVSANGEFYAHLAQRVQSTVPKLTEEQAYLIVKAEFRSTEIRNHHENENALRIYFLNNKYHLCYKFELSSFEPLKHAEFYVDANSGKIINEINRVHTVDVPGIATTHYSGSKTITCNNTSGTTHNLTTSGRNLYTRNCNNGTSLSTASEFTNSSSSWSATSIYNKSVFDLHYGLEKTYDYFLSKFTRTSYDNSGAQIRGISHYGSNYVNAFWSNPYMVFGDGDGTSYLPFTPIDIVGHEFTHAVTEYEANLVYMNQSGALNESFSDIFGVAIDFYAHPLTANFLEGEQCVVSGMPFRNMTNPNATMQPDTYLGTYWVPNNGPDNGGVHTNSQVQNYWFYLLCQGGSGINDISQSFSVSAIGISHAERIAYRNLSVYLTANSTFADARMYAIQSALDLYGACSNQVIQTTNAWHAVGVGNAFSSLITAQFAANPSFSCSAPATISFTNLSTNGVTYQWNFGDGSAISTATNPVHTYTAVGSYSVKLKSFGTLMCNSVDSIIKIGYVNITNSGSPTLMCQPLQGSNSSAYGITNVSFAAITRTSTGATEGYVNLTCSHQSSLTAGNPYLLSISKAYGLGRLAVWIDYNNDGVMNQTNELIYAVTPSVSLNTHTVVINTPTNAVLNTPLRMRVYDDTNPISNYCQTHIQGQTEDYAVRFYANTAAPLSNFFTTTRTVQASSNVSFLDSSLNAPSSWLWTFQGASPATSTLQNPTVFYGASGTYSVKLKVSNGFGNDSIVKMAYISVISNFNLCSPTTSTNLGAGNLFDSGGPSGSYQNSENCSFLINPGCNGTISISFSSFNTESGYDYLYIYNGSTTASPLLGSYSGSSLPPTLYANSGKMLVRFYTDGSIVSSGFAATWSSTLAGTSPPVASFSVSNNTPPINTPVQFTDLTTNVPYQWFWQFGDGTNSSLQHPQKTYTTSGVKSITLTATNCSTVSTVVSTVNVQSTPVVSLSPSVLSGTVNCGDSLVIPVNIQNTGLGQLTFTGQVKSSMDSVRVLICTYGVDMSAFGDYQKTLNAISSYFTLYSVSNYSGNTSAGLAAAANGKDVILFPRQSTLTDAHYSSYAAVLNSFANSGGSVIFCGSSSSVGFNRPFTTGLFNGSVWNWTSGFNVNIALPNDSLVFGLGSSTITAPNLTTYYNITTAGKVMVANYLGYDVITYRNIGTGRAIVIGADYFTSSLQFNYILARAVRTSRTKKTGYLLPQSGVVNASSTQSVNVVIKTTGTPGGAYTASLVLSGNQTPNPLTALINYTIVGTVNASLSANCINFGTIMQNTTKLDSVVLNNTGCAPLIVSSMSNSLAVFNSTPSAGFTLAPWSSTKIYVAFQPTLVGTYSDTLRLFTNNGQKKLCLQGIASTAPVMSVTPTSFTVTSPNCTGSQTIALTVQNTGGTFLNYTVSSAVPSVQVLAIMNYVDQTQEWPNTLSSLNTFFTNYALTTHTLGSVAAFQSALAGKHVLLIPEQETYVSGFMQSYSTAIANFVNAGGTAIQLGGSSLNQVNDIGLFTVSNLYINPGNITVIDTNDVIMKNVPMTTFAAPLVTNYNVFTNPWNFEYVKAGIYTTVAKRVFGPGRAIYLGFDYTNFNTHASRILSNAVKSSVNMVTWLSIPTSTGSLGNSQFSTHVFTLNASGLSPGTHTTYILIQSNDPLATSYTVPVTYSVNGSASSSVSPGCLNFGTVMQYANKRDSVTLYNHGCLTMTVSAMSTTNSAFTYTPSGSFTVGAWSSQKLYVKFTPTVIGTYQDSLRIFNNGGYRSVCLNGTAVAAPGITVSPASLSALAPQCNSTQTVNLQITNTGGSPLNYTILGSNNSATVQVLALTNGVDMFTEYPNTISAINQYFTGYQITQHSLITPAALQTALVGKQVLLIPEMESYSSGLLQSYSTTILSFVNAGGTAILCGSGYLNQINESGLFTASLVNYMTSGSMTVIDTNDVIMNGLPMGNLPYPNATFYATITNPGLTDYVKWGSYSIVSKRNIGLGRAIYMGFDYYLYSNQTARMIANSVRGTSALPSWLSVPSNTGIVNTGTSTTVTFTFSSVGLSPGTYTYNLVINTNSPLTPTLSVPVTYTVQGSASASLSPNCIAFGNILQYTNKTDSVTLYNTGCAIMTVSSITATNAVFSYTPSSSFTLAAGASRKLYVRFSPTLTGAYSDTLRLIYNGGIAKVCLSGTAQSAPSISVSPVPLSVNSIGCSASQTVAVTVSNTGGSVLNMNLSGGSSGATRQVLAITNYVDMAPGGEYQIMIGAINSFFLNYSITQHNLSSVAGFSAALAGKHVLIIPEQETYVTGFMQTYSATIINFVNAGGTAILCGTGGTNHMNDVGLFNTNFSGAWPPNMAVVDTNDAIMRSLPMGNILVPNATFYYTFTNPGVSNYVQYGIYSIVSKRNIGLGRAIYIGFDYFQTTPQVSRIIANAVSSSYALPSWLSVPSSSAAVSTGSSTTMIFTLNATGLASGNYTYNLLINSNDPLVPSFTLPVSFMVNTSANASVSPNCLNFGTIIQNTSKLDSLNLTNTGCSNMTVTAMTLTNSAFSYSPAPSFTLAPGATRKIYVNFVPTLAGSFSDTLRIFSNGGNRKVCLNGQALGMPVMSLSPPVLTTTLAACGSSQTMALVISNTGGTNLNFTYPSNSTASWLSTGPAGSGSLAAGASYTLVYGFSSGSLTAGTYSTNLVFTSNTPGTPSQSLVVSMVVGNNPCANFAFQNPNNCTGTVSFSQTVINTVTSYQWNFGDGNNSNLPNPVHTYTNSGVYVVTLTACNGTLCSTITQSLSISAVGGPLAAMCAPVSNTPLATYGIMNVKFNTINKSSGSALADGGYQDFSCYYQTTVVAGGNYSVNVTTSPSNSENVKVWIDYDNNGSFTPVELVYASLGTLTSHTGNISIPMNAVLNTPLRMRVEDDNSSSSIPSACSPLVNGQAEDYAVVITVGNLPPVVNFNQSINACNGTVTFTDLSTYNPSSWLWNFGDGNASTQQNPSHTYTASGTYSVTLVATNAFGSGFFTQTIVVNFLSFSISASAGPYLINSPVNFNSSFSGTGMYTWNFGDGNLSGTQNPVHTYTAVGNYTVSLTIVSGSCINTMSMVISVGEPTDLTANGMEKGFALQIYPNPFSEYTRLTLKLEQAGTVQMQVVNSLGQLIREIENKELSKGEHVYDLLNLSAGVYYLKLKAGQKELLYKLIATY